MSRGELPFPIKTVPLDPARDAAIRKAYPQIKDGFLQGEPGGHVMFPKMWDVAPKMYNFQVKPEDVWLCGFLKSGTNWLQEIMWLVNHDCDFELGKQKTLLLRVPTLELSYAPYLEAAIDKKTGKPLPNLVVPIEDLNTMTSPRHFKTHLPLHLLPPNLLDTCKVVYVARNPKDVIVSYYHYHKLVKAYTFDGSLEEFADLFMRNALSRAPYFGNVLEAWNQRHHPNLHFVFYEDLKKDLRGEIEKVANFLGREVNDQQMEALLKHSTFESCKKHINTEELLKDTGITNPGVEFFRKGKAGDWKNHFSPEMNARVDEWIKQNLENSDLTFQMELENQD